jgi:hypothetical protein
MNTNIGITDANTQAVASEMAKLLADEEAKLKGLQHDPEVLE